MSSLFETAAVGSPRHLRPVCQILFGGLLAGCVGLGGWTARAADDEPAAVDYFEQHIRPLLIDRCVECHSGPEPAGGLGLERRGQLLAGGDSGAAIDVEQPQRSLLLMAVRRQGGYAMPPDDPLGPQQIQQLAAWLESGAVWPEHAGSGGAPDDDPQAAADNHWAFRPVNRPAVPEMLDPSWARNPIDRFVLQGLHASDLRPAPEADRRTLIRRLSYSVSGLPPEPQQVERFVNDPDPNAYERLVDTYLADPTFGQHSARHWLDVARYSDTKGYVYGREQRFWPHAWVYRDWVAQAFSEDLPYDRFVLLQLAADQVSDARPFDRAAMGLLTVGRRFLGVKHDIIDDRIDVVTRGLLGLSVSCARCHNHKYDPIPIGDYYSLYGVFDSCRERLVPAGPEPPPPTTEEPFWAEYYRRLEALEQRLTESRQATSERARQRVGDYLRAQQHPERFPTDGFDQVFQPDDLLPAFVHRLASYLRRAEQDADPLFVPWHAYRKLAPEQFTQLASEVTEQLADRRAPPLHPWLLELFSQPPDSWDQVVERYEQLLIRALQQPESDLASAWRGVLYGSEAPLQAPSEPIVHIDQFFDSATTTQLWKLHSELEQWVIEAGAAYPFALMLEDRPVAARPRVFLRGQPTQPAGEVPRRFLTLLSSDRQPPFQHGSGRLELAEAIIDPTNRLTARVWVNRLWQQLMGQGLVTTASDFGLRAEPPSHPELIDWLADELVAGGWSTKQLMRQLLLSATFRQASLAADSERPAWIAATQRDPENRLRWRQSPHRLTFEQLRDSLLAVAGGLDRQVGGVAEPLFDSGSHRRSLYGLIDRQFVPSSLRIFDFASPDLHIPKRSQTTVPQQALFFMNHPWVLEQVRQIGDRHRQVDQPADGVTGMFEVLLQRRPSDLELAEALELVAVDAPAEPHQLNGWQQLAQVLICSNEFLFID
jgi:hypothetical protein